MNNKIKNKRNVINNGSITVEAAFVFPIFFFFFIVMLCFFQIMLIFMEVQDGLYQTASFTSQYAYFSEEFLKNGKNTEEIEKDKSETLGFQGSIQEFAEGLLDKALIKIKFQSVVDKSFLDSSCIKNGVSGISFLKSKVMEEGNDIDIVAYYKIDFPCPFFKLPSFTMIQRVTTKAYLGKSMTDSSQSSSGDNNDESTTVYITETGTVYHRSEECTYLNPSIRQISFSELEKERNQSGSKYVFCEYCCKKTETYNIIYITSWGTGYHSRLDCSRLKRTVTKISQSEAEEKEYRACSKCG
jgi:hypothetical protein